MLSSVSSFVKMWMRFWSLIVLAVKFILRYWTVPATGIVISSVLFWLFDISLAKIIFWGIFVAFIVAGAYILETNNTEKAEKFCIAIERTAKALFLLSWAGIVVKYTQLLSGEFWQIFAWPLFATSLILFVLSLFGQLGVSITIYEKTMEEDY